MNFSSVSKSDRIIPRFIVGMSRGGTTWMGKSLNEHPDTAVFGESLFWGRSYVEPEAEGKYSLEQIRTILNRLKNEGMYAFLGETAGCLKQIKQDNLVHLVNSIIQDIDEPLEPAKLFLLITQKIAQLENKQNVVEKTPHHVNWIDRIIRALPDSRFVIMIRDPYDFALSYKHQGDRFTNEEKQKHHRLYHPFLCAFLWSGYINAANKAIADYPEQMLLISTEEIKTNPQSVLNKTQKFLLLKVCQDLATKIPQDNSSFSEVEKPSLQAEDIFWLNLIAGKHIAQSNLTLQPIPFQPLRIVWSILKLPYWGIWSFFHLANKTEGSVKLYLWHWIKMHYT